MTITLLTTDAIAILALAATTQLRSPLDAVVQVAVLVVMGVVMVWLITDKDAPQDAGDGPGGKR